MPVDLKQVEALWNLFIHKCAVKTFSEKEMIAEGKKLVVLYGSVESHKKLFMEAAQELSNSLTGV